MKYVHKLKLYKVLSILTTFLGVVLMIYMINAEGELGALPLMLIAVGIIVFIIYKIKIRKI